MGGAQRTHGFGPAQRTKPNIPASRGFHPCYSLLFLFEPVRVTTGIALAIPDDIGALALPEPSMAELGIVPFADMFGADDRKPLSVLLMLHRRADGRGPGVTINRGDPIARLTMMPIVRIRTV